MAEERVVIRLIGDADSAQRATKQTVAGFESLEAELRQLRGVLQGVNGQVAQTTRTQVNGAAKSAAAQKQATTDIIAAQARQQGSARRTAGTQDVVNRRLGDYRRSLASTTRSLGRFIAASAGFYGIGFAISSAVRATVGFDKAMRNVNSIAQLSETALGDLSERTLDLARATGQAPQSLAEGLYDLVSSGFDADQSMKILRSSARAATAGLTDTATTTKVVAAVINAYGLKAKDAAEVSDILFRTVDRGVLSFGDLAQNLSDVLPGATQLGIPLEDVGAAIATITKQGTPAALATTQLSQAMVAFIKPSEGMKAAIKETGFESGEALIKAKGFQGALEAVTGATDGSKAAVGELFPEIRGMRAAFQLTGDKAAQAGEDIKLLGDHSGATSKALSQQSQSVAYQWSLLRESARALAIETGQKLIPSLLEMLDILKDPKLTDDQKWNKISDIIVPAIEDAFNAAITKAGEMGPKVAGAFVRGFLDAPPLAQILVGGWLFLKARQMLTAAGLLGRQSGAAWGAGFISTSQAAAAQAAAGGGVAGVLGGAAGGAAGGEATRQGPRRKPIYGPGGEVLSEVVIGGSAGAVSADRFGGGFLKRLPTAIRGAGAVGGALVAIELADKIQRDLADKTDEPGFWSGLGNSIKSAVDDIQLGGIDLGGSGAPDQASAVAGAVRDLNRALASGNQGLVQRYVTDLSTLAREYGITGNAIAQFRRQVDQQFATMGRWKGFQLGTAVIEDHRVTKAEIARMKATLATLPPAARTTATQTIAAMLGTLVASGDLPAAEFRRIMRRLKAAADTGGTQLVSSMATSFGAVLNVVSASSAGIFPPLNAALKALGADPVKVNASDFAAGALNLAVRGGQVLTGGGKKERGGFIGRPGEHGRDDQPLALPPKAAVATRHQQPVIEFARRMAPKVMAAGGGLVSVIAGRGERVMGDDEVAGASRDLAVTAAAGLQPFGSLREVFSKITTPHYMARGGFTPGKTGGGAPAGIVPIPGQPGESIHRSILDDVVALIARYKLAITDGYAPSGHAAGGEHPKGLAIDAVPGPGGSWDLVNKLAAWAEPRQGSPRKPFRWVGYTGDPGHGEGNHLHLSWAGGGGLKGAIGAALEEIKGGKVTGPAGALTDLAKGAVGKLREAANAHLSAQSTAPVGTSSDPGTASAVKGTYGKAQLKKLWTSAGGDPASANIAAAIALAESSGNPGARSANPSGGQNRGLWQVDSGSHPDSTFDPLGNAKAAVRISGNGRNWGPWEVFHTGAYKQYLARGGFVDPVQHMAKGGAVEGAAVPEYRKRFHEMARAAWPKVARYFGNHGGMPVTHFSKKAAYTYGNTPGLSSGVWVPAGDAKRAVMGPKGDPLTSYGLGTLVHEWAHIFQSDRETEGERKGEGGAEAFARHVAPRVFPDYGQHITEYPGLVSWVLKNKGLGWVLGDQFKGERSGDERSGGEGRRTDERRSRRRALAPDPPDVGATLRALVKNPETGKLEVDDEPAAKKKDKKKDSTPIYSGGQTLTPTEMKKYKKEHGGRTPAQVKSEQKKASGDRKETERKRHAQELKNKRQARRQRVGHAIKDIQGKAFKTDMPSLSPVRFIVDRVMPDLEDQLANAGRKIERESLLDVLLARGDGITDPGQEDATDPKRAGHRFLDIGTEQIADLTVAELRAQQVDRVLTIQRDLKDAIRQAVEHIQRSLAEAAKAIVERQRRATTLKRMAALLDDINDEHRKKKPNKKKIAGWQDQLEDLGRDVGLAPAQLRGDQGFRKTLHKRLTTESTSQSEGIPDFTQDQETLRGDLVTLIGTGGRGGTRATLTEDIADHEAERASLTPEGLTAQLQGFRPYKPDTSDRDEHLADLLRQQLTEATRTSALATGELKAFTGFKALTLPYLGGFERGVENIDRSGIAVIHKGETITRAAEVSRDSGDGVNLHVTLVGEGLNAITRTVDARIADRAPHVTDRALGRKSRTISMAPGRS